MSKLFIDKNLKALIGTIIKVITKISKNFSKLLLEKASKLFIDKNLKAFNRHNTKVITKISKISKLLLEKASKLFIDKRPQRFYIKEDFKAIFVDVATDYRKLRNFERL